MKLSLGTTIENKPFAVPTDAVTETFGLLAMRGAGKTNAARVMAEEMFAARLPFMAVDPVGSWWGLRSSNHPTLGAARLPIPIFGGRHGDVPIERGSGQFLADMIVAQRLSCVLDLTSFDSEAAKKGFLLDFARRLYQRNEEPLHLFLEEADDYIPQRPMRDEAQLLRAWENIVRRGRARGLGVTLITQRSAAINKNVLTQVQTLIAMRTTGPQDRAVIEDWLKYHAQSREILETLPMLDSGEAWVWSPQWLKSTTRIRFRRSYTFDSGETPKAGSSRAPATLADVDLGAISKAMAATIERAKAEDPRELRAKIAKLESDLRLAQAAKPAPERVEVPVISSPDLERFERAIDALSQRLQVVVSEVGMLRDAALKAAAVRGAQPSPVRIDRAPQPARVAPSPRSSSMGRQGKGERLILTALAQHPEGCSKTKVAILAGYAHNGGGFNNYLAALRSSGQIQAAGDRLRITDEGLRALGDFTPLPTGDELRAYWLGQLGRAEELALRALIDAYPAGLTREQIAERSGYSPDGGGFNNALSRLRTLELISGRGEMTASGHLF